jgi:hypothetical protein
MALQAVAFVEGPPAATLPSGRGRRSLHQHHQTVALLPEPGNSVIWWIEHDIWIPNVMTILSNRFRSLWAD